MEQQDPLVFMSPLSMLLVLKFVNTALSIYRGFSREIWPDNVQQAKSAQRETPRGQRGPLLL